MYPSLGTPVLVRALTKHLNMQVSAVNHIRFNTVSTVLRRHVLECQQ